MNADMKQIEEAAQEFATYETALRALVSVIDQELDAVYGQHRRELHRVCKMRGDRKKKLEDLVAAHPALFDKPRTQVFHDIKVGYRKGTGKMEWDSAERVVALIRKHFPELVDVLVHVEETPVVKALEELEGSDLKKLGVTVEATGDVVVVKPVAKPIEKVIAALLKKTGEDAAERQAA